MDEIDELFRNSRPSSEIGDFISRHDIDPVRARNSKQQTLLHISAGYGRMKLVDNLLSQGADVHAQDERGQVPLHNAACHGHFSVSIKLIEAGADVNQTDHKGWTPLHFAISRKDNAEKISPIYRKVIDLLVSSGANPLFKSSTRRRSPFDKMNDPVDRSEILTMHLSFKIADPEFDDELRRAIVDNNFSVDSFFELIKEGDERIEQLKLLTTPKLIESQLETIANIYPLHRAAGYNQLETARFFIENGANVNVTDVYGRIPLHNAAQHGHSEMIKLLVSHGSDVNKQDEDGLSPLHVAASNQTHSACLLLVKLGSLKNLESKSGQLPYDLAESDDVKETLKIPNCPEVVPSTSEQAIYMDLKPIANETNQYSTLPDNLLLNSSSDKRLFANKDHSIKKVFLDRESFIFAEVKRRMLSSIVAHSGDSGGCYSSFDIISVEKLLNEEVWSRYRFECQKLEKDYGSKNERLLFHGLLPITLQHIECHGFDERYAKRDGMFGAGIYFAENSSKSNQYSFGLDQGCPLHKDKSCYTCERKMIYAQVALGRSLRGRVAMPLLAHAPPGYTSITGSPESTENLMYPEYVIYNRYHAYPLYMITYKLQRPSNTLT